MDFADGYQEKNNDGFYGGPVGPHGSQHSSLQRLSQTLRSSLDGLLGSIEELAEQADRQQDTKTLTQCEGQYDMIEQVHRAWQLCEAIFLSQGPVGYEIIPWLQVSCAF